MKYLEGGGVLQSPPPPPFKPLLNKSFIMDQAFGTFFRLDNLDSFEHLQRRREGLLMMVCGAIYKPELRIRLQQDRIRIQLRREYTGSRSDPLVKKNGLENNLIK